MQEFNITSMAKYLTNEDEAFKLVESIVWSNGIPTCPHCKNEGAYKLTPKAESKKPVRRGAYKCKSCRKIFTVRTGTIFEDSHLPLGKWLYAIHILCSSKKSISAHQLHRQLDITYKTAWFLLHRIRYVMDNQSFDKLSGDVEVDETYVGGKPRKGNGKTNKRGRGTSKTPVVALVQRKGNVKTRVVPDVSSKTLKNAIRENVELSSRIITDEWRSYNGIGKEYEGGHFSVNHGRYEFDRDGINTNTAESFFALFKRSIYGTWHHISKKHIHRYSIELEYRWNRRKNTDSFRTKDLLSSIIGKRMSYKQVKSCI